MKKQRAWHNRDHHNRPMQTSLSKYCPKRPHRVFSPNDWFPLGPPCEKNFLRVPVGQFSAFGRPTIMHSAKQINFLAIFKIFQNWRTFIFGRHSISWTLTAIEVKKFLIVFWEMKRTSETVEQLLPFREGKIEAECNLGQGRTGCWWQRPMEFSLPHFPLIWSKLCVVWQNHFALVLY